MKLSSRLLCLSLVLAVGVQCTYSEDSQESNRRLRSVEVGATLRGLQEAGENAWPEAAAGNPDEGDKAPKADADADADAAPKKKKGKKAADDEAGADADADAPKKKKADADADAPKKKAADADADAPKKKKGKADADADAGDADAAPAKKKPMVKPPKGAGGPTGDDLPVEDIDGPPGGDDEKPAKGKKKGGASGSSSKSKKGGSSNHKPSAAGHRGSRTTDHKNGPLNDPSNNSSRIDMNFPTTDTMDNRRSNTRYPLPDGRVVNIDVPQP